MIRLIALFVLLAGCSSTPPAPTPVVIHSGQSTLHSLPAGTYSVAWTSDCSALRLEWAPTPSGAPVPIPVDDPAAGSTTIAIPGGQAYLNGTGGCETGWTVTITAR